MLKLKFHTEILCEKYDITMGMLYADASQFR